MSDFEAMAARLYPSSAPSVPAADTSASAAPAEPAQIATTEQTPPAETETPTAQTSAEPTPVPDEIAKLRDDPLRRMFSPQGTYASLQLEAAMEHVAAAPELKAAAAAEYREIFADMGASGQDAQEMVDAASRFGTEPMTRERDAANEMSAIELLNQHFGDDATDALKAAQQMIARDPRLVRMLEQSRLGNDPKTVLKIAQLARSAKLRG